MDNVGEWSREFDQMFDNITSGRAPGVVPYEKSLFLTNAQDKVAIALYKGQLGDAFESTEEITSYLASLVKQVSVTSKEADPAYKISDKSQVFKISNDILFITYEECDIEIPSSPVNITKTVPVLPLTQDEYRRTTRNPFKRQTKDKVLRVSYSEVTSVANNLSEYRFSDLISNYNISKYTVRYLKAPEPIILEALTGGLTIKGHTAVKTCLMPKALHQAILSEAVAMAKAAWLS